MSISRQAAPGASGIQLLNAALPVLQDRPEGAVEVIFLIGAAAIGLIVLGYLLVRRSRQYPVDSPFSPETRGGRASGDDEEEVETIL